MNAPALTVDGLIARVLDLNVPVIVERSIKFTPGALLTRRALVSFPKAALGRSGLARLSGFTAALGMPAQLANMIAADFPAAEVVHVGVEEERICKLYFEFPQTGRRSGADGNVLVFRAVKWDMAQPGSGGVSTYRTVPGLNGAAITDRIRAGLRGVGQAPASLVLDLLARAHLSNPAEPLAFLEVEDEGTPRRSFDLNFYDAGFILADAAPAFPGLADHFSLPAADILQLAGLPHGAALGHVAAGVARDGREFLTIFYGGGAP